MCSTALGHAHPEPRASPAPESTRQRCTQSGSSGTPGSKGSSGGGTAQDDKATHARLCLCVLRRLASWPACVSSWCWRRSRRPASPHSLRQAPPSGAPLGHARRAAPSAQVLVTLIGCQHRPRRRPPWWRWCCPQHLHTRRCWRWRQRWCLCCWCRGQCLRRQRQPVCATCSIGGSQRLREAAHQQHRHGATPATQVRL